MDVPATRILRVLLAGVLALVLAPTTAASADGPSERAVLVATVDAPITGVTGTYLVDGAHRAEREGYRAFLVELSTGGGPGDVVREVTAAFAAAEVPVLVQITPPGGGVTGNAALIVFAADLLTMAPGTIIGYTAPPSPAAAARAARIAARQGHDPGVAAGIVRDAAVLPVGDAVNAGAAYLLVPDREAVLEVVDDERAVLGSGERTVIDAAGVTADEHRMGFFDAFRQTMAEQHLPLMFLPAGMVAVIYAFAGARKRFVAGAIGVGLLALGIVSLTQLPLRTSGLGLLVVAIGLYCAVLFVSRPVAVAALASVTLAAAGILLLDPPFTVNPWVLWPVAVAMGIAAAPEGRLADRVHHHRYPARFPDDLVTSAV